MQHHGENSPEITRANLAKRNYRPEIITSVTTERVTDEPVAMLFIDSHHAPATMRQELEAYYTCLMPNAVVALHDYGRDEYPGYSEGIDEYFGNSPEWTRQSRVESLIAFKRQGVADAG